ARRQRRLLVRSPPRGPFEPRRPAPQASLAGSPPRPRSRAPWPLAVPCRRAAAGRFHLPPLVPQSPGEERPPPRRLPDGPPPARLDRTARGIVPANMSREDEGLGQLFAGRQARRLLLRLGREPAGLRPELAEDVLDAGEVRLRLDELVLCLAPPPLMATDAGDLLE